MFCVVSSALHVKMVSVFSSQKKERKKKGIKTLNIVCFVCSFLLLVNIFLYSRAQKMRFAFEIFSRRRRRLWDQEEDDDVEAFVQNTRATATTAFLFSLIVKEFL